MDRATNTADVHVRLCGVPPGLLMHNPEAMLTQQATKKDPTPEEEAHAAAYRQGDGSLYIPGRCIFAMLRDSATKIKRTERGRKREGHRQAVCGYVDVLPDQIPLGTKDYEILVVTARLATTRNAPRIIRARPLLPEWSVDFTLRVGDTDEAPLSILEEALVVAGERIGLMDWRPACSGRYGRFIMERFEANGQGG